MSRVDDLIKELCPNGVEFKRIGDLAVVGTGSSDRKDASVDGPYPFYVRSKQLMKHDKFEFDETAIIIPGEGNIGEVFHYQMGKYALHQRAYRIAFTTDSVLTKFAYYYFAANFKKFILKKAVSATVTSIRKPMVIDFEIPVPPLEIQQEIARILDKFTQLEAELEAELEARRKQYAYYLEKLGEKLRTKFSTASLGDVGDWVGGNTPSKSDPKYWENGEILWVSSKDMKASSITDTKFRVTDRAISEGPARLIPKHSVLVVTRSSILERTLPVATLAMEATINQDIKAILPSEDFDHRYIYFAIKWSSDEILRTIRKSGGSVTSLDTKKLKDFKIPAPPLEDQRRIVAILDKFDALVNDISTGLPAEIAARRKQYEYYRDKLLSFQPATAAQQ